MIDDTANDIKRLRKILAMTATENEGESIAAFLMAKRLMEKLDIGFDRLIDPDNPVLFAIRDFDLRRLRKILALTSSGNEGETVAAFLMAKRLMGRTGISFEQLLDFNRYDRANSMQHARTVGDMEVISLKKRIARLQAELVDKTAQLERYKEAFDSMIGNAWDMQNLPKEANAKQQYLN